MKRLILPLLCMAFAVSAAIAAPPFQNSSATAPASWISKSNQNAELLLKVIAKYSPESAARIGVDGLDNEIFDLKPQLNQRLLADMKTAKSELQTKLADESDPSVRQDIEILMNSVDLNMRGTEIEEKNDIVYYNLSEVMFSGTSALLDDQIPAKRRNAALVRIRKYVGLEPGYTPITQLAMERTRERLKNASLYGPIQAEVMKGLQNDSEYIAGIEELFKKYSIAGYEEPFNALKKQLNEYHAFIESELLPRARKDYRLPPGEYDLSLANIGVDIPPAELAAMAHKAFDELQKQMQEMAPKVAKEKGINATDYRDVIRELKKSQLVGDNILPFYKEINKKLEAIITREHIVTLPTRDLRIRIASPAEAAAVPAPNMRPPRIMGNTGEMGEFILPLNVPVAPGDKKGQQKMDDFTYEGAAWHLSAHEARPGHELQFASVIEKGVSVARQIFAFNSVNVEGWGLYAETIMQPYEPLDAQFLTIHSIMMRAARAFLDPELQAGKITPDQALKFLETDLVLSHALANSEVERYTFRSPGQATSYFYGYTRLKELRADTEQKLGKNFDQQKFHDFILSQGLLPPNLIRKAVMAEFVK